MSTLILIDLAQIDTILHKYKRLHGAVLVGIGTLDISLDFVAQYRVECSEGCSLLTLRVAG